MRFFEPSDEYLDWFEGFVQKKLVVDVGCGEGHVVAALQARGVACIGIDLFPSQEGTNIITGDATKILPSLSSKMMLPVFFRPCHGQFIQNVVSAAHEVSPWLYVGLRKNVEGDLHGYHTKELNAPVGLEGEVTILFSANESDLEDRVRGMDKWWLIRSREGTVYWARRFTALGGRGEPCETGGYWINSFGGGFNVGSEEVLATAMAFSEDELPQEQTTSYRRYMEAQTDERLFTGWLSPDGKLLRCAYHEHDDFCHVVMKMNVTEAQDKGWMKVHLDRADGPWGASFLDGPTEAQAKTLLDLETAWKRSCS